MTDKLIEVTSDGIIYMSENEIYQSIIDKMLEIDPNWNLDVSTHDGYMTAWHAENYRILIEAIVECYNSKDPNKSRDIQLNILSALTGTTREDGTGTVINITNSGTNGSTIPAGSIIEIEGVEYSTDAESVIGSASAATTATCLDAGVIDPTVGSDVTIRTTISGWASCTLDSIEALGTDQESNTSLRVKRKRAVASPGNNQVDSTIGEIFAVDDVTNVHAYENPTGSNAFDAELNPYSLPKNSVSYVVKGGSDGDVAKAIYRKKNPGVFLNQAGTGVAVNVTSEKYPQNSLLVKFGRPTLVNMTAVIEISDPQNNIPTNIAELVRDSIISYVNGSLIDEVSGFDQTGFDIGESVPVRRLDTPINKAIGNYEGAYISNVTVNGGTGLINIDFDEISSWSSDNITVTVV